MFPDVLLCHDDELEERRIAFIYYLVPELWSQSDGGTLDLFDAGGKLHRLHSRHIAIWSLNVPLALSLISLIIIIIEAQK